VGIVTLAKRIEEISLVVRGGNKCAYQLMLDSMKSEDRKALETAWQQNISRRIILRSLRSEGYKTSNESITNHQTGNCKCPKN